MNTTTHTTANNSSLIAATPVSPAATVFTPQRTVALRQTVTPFSYMQCRCHTIVDQARDTVDTSAVLTTSRFDSLLDAIIRTSNIDWTGNAATLFRERMTMMCEQIVSYDADVETTVRMAT